MATRERLVCDCGGVIGRPLPRQCPHCGAAIVGVRRRLGSQLVPVLVVGLLFALLAGFVLWMVGAW